MKVEFDYSKLRGRIVEKYGSIEAFSKNFKMSNVSISKKLNNKISISREDIITWSELLEIPPEQYGAFYFVKKFNDVERKEG